jgi:hypothetical protein
MVKRRTSSRRLRGMTSPFSQTFDRVRRGVHSMLCRGRKEGSVYRRGPIKEQPGPVLHTYIGPGFRTVNWLRKCVRCTLQEASNRELHRLTPRGPRPCLAGHTIGVLYSWSAPALGRLGSKVRRDGCLLLPGGL